MGGGGQERAGPWGTGLSSRKRGCTRAAPARTWVDTLPEGELEGELAEGLVRCFSFDPGLLGCFDPWSQRYSFRTRLGPSLGGKTGPLADPARGPRTSLHGPQGSSAHTVGFWAVALPSATRRAQLSPRRESGVKLLLAGAQGFPGGRSPFFLPLPSHPSCPSLGPGSPGLRPSPRSGAGQ